MSQWSEQDKAFAGSIADLVALVYADHENLQSLAFIRSAMDTAAEANIVVDRGGRSRQYNRMANRVFGLPHDNGIDGRIPLVLI